MIKSKGKHIICWTPGRGMGGKRFLPVSNRLLMGKIRFSKGGTRGISAEPLLKEIAWKNMAAFLKKLKCHWKERSGGR
jgi:hypothetical protein